MERPGQIEACGREAELEAGERETSHFLPAREVEPQTLPYTMTYARINFPLSLMLVLLLSPELAGQSSVQTIDQLRSIKELTIAEASAGLPCELEATVYFCDPRSYDFIAGQENNFVLVKDSNEFLEAGTRVRIRGKTSVDPNNSGNLVRLQECTRIDSNDQNTMVAPMELNISKIATVSPGSWVVCNVNVFAATTDLKTQVTLLRAVSGDRRLTILLPYLMDVSELAELIGARIRVTGNLQQNFVDDTAPEVLIACPQGFLEQISEAKNPLTIQTVQSIDEIRRSDDSHFYTSGVVTFSTSDGFFVQKGDQGTFFHNRGAFRYSSGDVVFVAGRIQRRANRTTNLVAQVTFRHETRPLSEPPEREAAQITGDNADGIRIKVRGTFDHFETSEKPDKIVLRSQGRVFEVHLWNDTLDSLDLETARVIEAVGTCSVYGASESDFIVHAPSLSDVRVIERVSFWTPVAVGSLACGLIIFLAACAYFLSLQSRLRKNRNDLSDLRARLQLVSATVRDGIVITDEAGNILHQNQCAADIVSFPLKIGDDIRNLQSHLAMSIVAEGAELHWERWNRSRSAVAELCLHVENPKCGKTSVLEFYTAPIIDARGKFLARLWAIYDMTEKHQLQQSVAEAEKVQAIGRVTSGVAHDFNNLLTVVKASLEVTQLNPDLTEDQTQELLGSALEATDRAAELVSQMLSYSRKTPLKKQNHDINQLVRRVTDLVRPSLSDSQQLSVDLASDLPLVKVDDRQMEQALLNLCLNAVDAVSAQAETKQGEIIVCTRLQQDVEGDEVVISIRDTGCGMGRETLDQVFEPFFTTKQDGSGLGLAMVQGTIQQHGGRILADSVKGKGSAFHVHLPAEIAGAIPYSKEEVSPNAAQELGGKCVLVVDDKPGVRRAVRRLLESVGANVHTASSGHEAIEFLRSGGRVDLVLLDWLMPGMNGGEVLRHIRRHHPELATFICTGNASDVENIGHDLDVAPDVILQKPISANQLSEMLKTHSIAGKLGSDHS